MDSVLSFIKLIRDSCPELQVKIFTEGACYQFFLILQSRFPSAVPYYDGDHVITCIDGKFYDITGQVEKGYHGYMEERPKGWGCRYPVSDQPDPS
jgi:hypothetical protein